MTIGENFPSYGQVRPSAAAAARRAGPVLAPLRAAGPPAARNTKHDGPKNANPHRLSGIACSPDAGAEVALRSV
jgi:hypothetical protein